ncbi:MAG TPA: restriction endonuclease subunit S [Candidatus Ozemobacteraceae bacterium]|nr:restriction endonuclease subunit S [Candidatus Ozemobacteraceae bacterium]
MAGDLFEVEELIRRGVLLINDGYRAKNSELSKVGIPFARAGNIDEGFHFQDADRVPFETLEKVGLKRSKPGDVVFTSKGTVGRFAFVREDTPEFVYSPQLCYWRSEDASRINPRWLFYWMQGREFFMQYKGVAGQTDMAEYVSLRDQRAMKITLPPLPEQKAIAHILGTIDDKIELNRRMNETLEGIARALFQSWFVDFDPVRAKLDGRQPAGMDAETAALFPGEFQDSSLGLIPKGWCVKSIGEILELAYGKPLKAEDRKNGHVSVYGANGPVGWHNERLVPGPGIVIGRKGNPGVVTWAHDDFYPIDTTFYVVPTSDCRSLYFLYYALSAQDLANLSADSAVPGLNRNHAYMSKQVIPSQVILKTFDSQISPVFAAIYANEEQSRTLAALRDTLLPKLLSGELSVADAVSLVEDVAS